MRIDFINVGYGEAILIRYDNFTMLIDGGSADPGEYAAGTPRVRCVDYLRAKGVSSIDLLVNTHIHEDHTCGLYEVASAIPVREIWTNLLPRLPDRDLDAKALDRSMDKFIRALNDHRRLSKFDGIRTVHSGMDFEAAPGLCLEVLSPSPEQADMAQSQIESIWRDPSPESIRELDARMNNLSVIIRLCLNGHRALLVGDTNKEGYSSVDKTRIIAQVVKIGHHGQIDGIDEGLLRAISPRYAVFTASSDRRYDSAHPDLIALVKSLGITPVFTDPPGGRHQAACFVFSDDGISCRYENMNGDVTDERV
ncbi:MAG: MBL fold metallo-hydrolase [Clostridia bacterium]|nr:MBL fold metallo-hydrolase [Clostridia bacterium]